jgi:hypothetical protein
MIVTLPAEARPILTAVVDTEEEYDWGGVRLRLWPEGCESEQYRPLTGLTAFELKRRLEVAPVQAPD